MQEKIRLSQVLTLFYGRISQKNFRFEMIYAYPFESIWFTFREKFAPANTENSDNDKTLRLSASCHSLLWMTSCRKPKKIIRNLTSRCYDYHTYVWQMTVGLKCFMTLFLGAEPFLLDDSQIETARRRSRRAGMSRAKYTRVKEESARNEGLYSSLTVGVLCPAELSF